MDPEELLNSQPVSINQEGQANAKAWAQVIADNSFEFPLNKELQPYDAKVIFTIRPPKIVAPDVTDVFQDIVNEAIVVQSQDQSQRVITDKMDKDNTIPKPLSSGTASNALDLSQRVRIRGASCSLYLPESINIADAVQIGNIDLGGIGGAVTKAISGGGNVVDNLKTLSGNTIKDFVGMFTSKGYKDDVAKAASLRAMGAISTDATRFASAATGVTVNPNTMAIFEGVNLRAFNFDFVLMPTSAEEAKAIQNIILFFRRELYPERIDAAGISLGYNFPNLFEIQFKYKDKDIATKLDLCYLKAFTATYNNGSQAFHKDGQFTSTQISMQFVEIEALHRQKIIDGY